MDTEAELKKETIKWLEKAEKAVLSIKASDSKGAESIVNIKAYISDTMHFQKKGDHVRAFEAVIWAWAWLEIGKNVGILEDSGKR
ncbi:MAG: DUF357 domain-containing protein [archaeon]|nr:DUF357 domain-containing protein [archaeon]